MSNDFHTYLFGESYFILFKIQAKTWEANSKRRAQFCQTETKPVILWAPKTWNDKTNDLKSDSQKLEKALLKERRQEWEKFDEELDEEISQIRETNDFDDNELTVGTWV